MTTPFKLATVSSGGSPPYVALVLGEQAFGLDLALERWGRAGAKRRQLRVSSMLDLLSDWEANFDVLQDFAEFVSREGLDSELWRGAMRTGVAAPLPRASAAPGQNALCGHQLSPLRWPRRPRRSSHRRAPLHVRKKLERGGGSL